MKNAILIFMLMLAGTRMPLAEETVGQVLAVRPGDEADASALGYGWSHPERLSDGSTFRWIEKREGDLNVVLGEPSNALLAVEIMPMVSDRRIQNFGVYVNRRFVAEWVLESSGRFQWFETEIPAECFRSGTNTVTIRAGYKQSPDADPRTLSVAVKQLTLIRHE